MLLVQTIEVDFGWPNFGGDSANYRTACTFLYDSPVGNGSSTPKGPLSFTAEFAQGKGQPRQFGSSNKAAPRHRLFFDFTTRKKSEIKF